MKREMSNSPIVSFGLSICLSIFTSGFAEMTNVQAESSISDTMSDHRMIQYDPATGEETVHTIDVPTAVEEYLLSSPGKGVLPENQQDRGEELLNFADHTPVTDIEDFPWCASVKLRTVYRSLSSVSYGSGILIDPLHVLTAAHVVYEKPSRWFDTLEVVPAYHYYDEGQEVRMPYGSVDITCETTCDSVYVWESWKERPGDYFSFDLAVIRLKRPIGFVTGYLDYGYNNDCQFFKNTEFYILGYPFYFSSAGKTPYYFAGSFDDCYPDLLKFGNVSKTGESGGGVYDTQDLRVYGVLVSGYGSLTSCVRLTEDKCSIISDFIRDNTPSQPDLRPMNVSAPITEIAPDQRLSSLSFLVCNYSQSAWADSVVANIYLSNDEIIGSDDRKLRTFTVNHALPEKSSCIVCIPDDITIPSDVSEGSYWLGVELEISDADTVNNFTSPQDALQIAIKPSESGASNRMATPARLSGPVATTPGFGRWVAISENRAIVSDPTNSDLDSDGAIFVFERECLDTIDGMLLWSSDWAWKGHYPGGGRVSLDEDLLVRKSGYQDGILTLEWERAELTPGSDPPDPFGEYPNPPLDPFDDPLNPLDPEVECEPAQWVNRPALYEPDIESFGTDIAVSGNYLVVGAFDSRYWCDDILGGEPLQCYYSETGSARVYEWIGSNWSRISDIPFETIEMSVAPRNPELPGIAPPVIDPPSLSLVPIISVATNGYDVMIGSPYDDMESSGAVHLANISSGSYGGEPDGQLYPSTMRDSFGYCIDMDGNSAIVGAPGSSDESGFVYIYTCIGTKWDRQQIRIVTPEGITNQRFGSCVAIKGDKAVVGYLTDVGPSKRRAVCVLERKGINWIPVATLLAPDDAEDLDFGQSVDISLGHVIVGAPGGEHGGAYIYHY